MAFFDYRVMYAFDGIWEYFVFEFHGSRIQKDLKLWLPTIRNMLTKTWIKLC